MFISAAFPTFFSQAGKSEPSPDSTSVRTTAKGVAPMFDGRRQEVVVLVGEDAKLKVPLPSRAKAHDHVAEERQRDLRHAVRECCYVDAYCIYLRTVLVYCSFPYVDFKALFQLRDNAHR